ncbi:hypothetical protein [Mameliella alba]|uniref:hypothetical protein n=1 Tax=Mameliella alba TaxID=561184 RepID=UPI000B53786F|nr:hypothetical protein [Mameliella alba]MBY6118844.1 hypothetical protein [Mameliella alba]OWV43776.1 hypothetical protein CDZ95_08905 [Mameliella alba]OWV67446.1 hypothetical protein CDZ97_03135 [Mameliella alba]
MIRCLSLFLLAAGPAVADCSTSESTFVQCRIAGSTKILEVCAEQDAAVYRFGPAGRPEMELFEPYAMLDYQPWPGVGRDIWEEASFRNEEYRYTVFAGVERQVGDTETSQRFGGVTVSRDGKDLARLECDPDTVTFGFGTGLSDGKSRAGYRWLPGEGWVR